MADEKIETEEETEVVETPLSEEKPALDGNAIDNDNEEEPKKEDGPAPEVQPPADDDWKKSEVYTETEKMSHGFRKRIEKMQQKHQSEMDELRKSYEDRLKAVEERTAPKKVPLSRDQFKFDDDYMRALAKEQIENDRAEREKAAKEQADREAEERTRAEEAQAEIRKRQDTFRKNTHDSFDADGEKRFEAQVQYAVQHGFGDVLDANPVASDYLLGNRMGPKVMSHLLNHPDDFKAVFVSEGQTQMDQYYTLKQIEARVLAEGRTAEPTQEPEPEKKTFKLGKPGGQGSSTHGATNLDDPIARRDWLRKLGVC
jgi:hypothetical protein